MPGLSSPYGAIRRLASGLPAMATQIIPTIAASTSAIAIAARGPVIQRAPTAAISTPERTSDPSPYSSYRPPPRGPVPTSSAVVTLTGPASGADDLGEGGVVLGLDLFGQDRESLGVGDRRV